MNKIWMVYFESGFPKRIEATIDTYCVISRFWSVFYDKGLEDLFVADLELCLPIGILHNLPNNIW